MSKPNKLLQKYDLPEDISTVKRDLIYLRNIIKDAPGIIYWKDRSGHYLGCNQFALDLMRKSGVIKNSNISEIIGKTDFDLFDKTTAEQYQLNDKRVIDGKKSLTQEETVTFPNGEVRQQLSIKHPLYDENNDIVGVVGNTIDITEKKKNEKLEKDKAIADETIRLLQLLAGAIAHEIRTPLATISAIGMVLQKILPSLIKGYNTSIENKLIKPDIKAIQLSLADDAAKSLQKEANEANAFIDDVLGNVKLLALSKDSLDTLSMKAVVASAIERFNFEDESERRLVHINIEQDFEFKGTAIFMQHVFFNLIKNALHYIHEAKKGEIYISTKLNSQWNILYFKDTGPGMDEEVANTIFDKGFVSKRTGGTGVGLGFCKQIILQCVGEISCESKKGEYTEFIIKLPHITK